MLLAHDWSKLDFSRHASKADLATLTHRHDVGYELTTALAIDAADGAPIAPPEVHLRTGQTVHSTAATAPPTEASHLDQILPTMEATPSWSLGRRVVHVIDREADSVGHYRQWHQAGHLFLVRGDDRRVSLEGRSWLIWELAEHFAATGRFADAGAIPFQSHTVCQQVASASVVLDRPARTRRGGRQVEVPGEPLTARLVLFRVVDALGEVLASWTLWTNVPGEPAGGVDRATIGRGYAWRWRIESYFKLLKSHGQSLESWRQTTGLAIARRLLIAAMACVVIWQLQRATSPEAERAKGLVMRLSGRQTKRSRPVPAPGLLAGSFVLLSVMDLLDQTGMDLTELRALARTALPHWSSG